MGCDCKGLSHWCAPELVDPLPIPQVIDNEPVIIQRGKNMFNAQSVLLSLDDCFLAIRQAEEWEQRPRGQGYQAILRVQST